MNNKNIPIVFLRVCAASVAALTQPALALGAVQHEAASDIEVGAVRADAGPPAPASSAATASDAPASSTTDSAGAPREVPSVPVPPSQTGNAQPSTATAAGAVVDRGAQTQAPAESATTPVAVIPAATAPVAATATGTSATSVAPTPSKNTNPMQALGEGIRLSGYFQAQYESHRDSEDQLNQSSALLNQDRFVLRRGRVRIGRDWDYAALLVEFDGNTVKGPGFRWQKAEASLVYGRSPDKDVWPLVQFTMGMFDYPFGYELVESPKSRPFMERTTGGRALWPSEPDVGARLMGQVNFFRYTVALTNGEPLDEKSGFGLQDPNKNKDVTVRFGAVTKPWPRVTVSGDVSYSAGKGFHPGTAATKASTTWQDLDHNGLVGQNELVGNPASTATPSMNFSRWALGADAQFTFETVIGRSMVYGEVVVAQNLDRGLFIADPVAIGGQSTRQLAYYVGVVQEITPYGLIGFRTDCYDPNADFLDQRAGKLIPASQTIRNYSPLIGLVLPERAKLLFQYDVQTNLFGRDITGAPARYPNNTATLRLQVNL